MNFVVQKSSGSEISGNEVLTSSGIASAPAALHSIRHLLSQGKRQRALTMAESAVRRWSNDIPLLLTAGQLASSVGRLVAAKQLLSRAARLGNLEAAHMLQSIIDEAAPYWHFRMMNDEIRNDAYNQALQTYVKPDSIVLDIGSGAGLLSMMAARANAQHVYTCDVSELLLDKARAIFDLNGFSKKITAFHSISSQLQVGKQLPRKADVIVAEVFDSGLLGEKALSTFAHAREHLLAPGGKILPSRASVQARLIESRQLQEEVKTYQCAGFDVTPMNELTPSYFQERTNTHEHRFLSESETVLRFNFEQNESIQRRQRFSFCCSQAGLCHGVAFWFTLDFGNKIELSTSPANSWNCWKQAICIFESPVELLKGHQFEVDVIQAAHRISFKPAQ